MDGSWKEEDGTGGDGSWQSSLLHVVSSALDAEVAACLEGVTLALEWSKDQLIIETDSETAARMISDQETNRSPVAAMVEATKQLLAQRPHEILAVRCEQNKASHALARMGSSLSRTAVWLRCAPDELNLLCEQDCNVPA